jgi:flagellar biosynthetic protein FlhB
VASVAENDNDIDNDDKTEEASVERREDFRERGSVAHSHELSQVAGLAAIAIFLGWYAPQIVVRAEKILINNFKSIEHFRVNEKNILTYLGAQWVEILYITLPFFLVAAVASSLSSLLQTQFNWSWKKLEPDWSKLNPITGIGRLFSKEMLVGLFKTIAKLLAVSVVAWLVLAGEWRKVPALLHANYAASWMYWTEITQHLLWGVVGLMLFVGAADFIYNFITLENKMKMTKQEVKEETKQRESDPHVKAKLRRMAREIATRKTVENTRKATVLITNPTHYSIAIRYELGMPAPLVVAKGVDFLALKMRETAKELDIPIVENKSLARAIYASVKEGDEIPAGMYQAISEIIRFVFKLKGISIAKKTDKNVQQPAQDV